jgi:hypothetical protein
MHAIVETINLTKNTSPNIQATITKENKFCDDDFRQTLLPLYICMLHAGGWGRKQSSAEPTAQQSTAATELLLPLPPCMCNTYNPSNLTNDSLINYWQPAGQPIYAANYHPAGHALIIY